MSDLAERAVSIVEMQHIAHILTMQALLLHKFEDLVILLKLQEFLPAVVLGQHVQGEDIGQSIIIEVGHFSAHREL